MYYIIVCFNKIVVIQITSGGIKLRKSSNVLFILTKCLAPLLRLDIVLSAKVIKTENIIVLL